MYQPERIYDPTGQRLADYQREAALLRRAARVLSWANGKPEDHEAARVQALAILAGAA